MPCETRITNVYHAIVYDDAAARSSKGTVLYKKWKKGALPVYPAINTQSRKNTIWLARSAWSQGGKGILSLTYQHAKHLGYQPPVARDSGPVFEQLFLRPLDVVHHVFSVDGKGQPAVFWVGRVGGRPGWTYVLASMRWIISDCSLTMPASCPKLWYMPISHGPRRE